MTKNIYVRAALLVVGLFGVAAVVPRIAGDALDRTETIPSVREIHIVAKDMTFYVVGNATPNPTLRARAGERVRLVLQNTDTGMSHDFSIHAWKVNTRLLKGQGQDTIEFTVPLTRGAEPYSCTPHAEMMGGTIVVD